MVEGNGRHEETRSPDIYGINYLCGSGNSASCGPLELLGALDPIPLSKLIKNASDGTVLLQRFGGSKNPPHVVT